MKRRLVMETPPPASPGTNGRSLSAQTAGDIMVLNYWKDKELIGRYCLSKSGEYAVYQPKEGTWKTMKLMSLLSGEHWYNYSIYQELKETKLCPADKKTIRKFIEGTGYRPYQQGIVAINEIEQQYGYSKREKAAQNRRDRIKGIMAQVPNLPAGFKDWVFGTVMQGDEYAFYDKDRKEWGCTACGGAFLSLPRPDGKESRHNDETACPACQSPLQAKTRVASVSRWGHCVVMQDVNGDMSVIRHIDIKADWAFGGKKLAASDAVRTVLYRRHKKGATHETLFNQHPKSETAFRSIHRRLHPRSTEDLFGWTNPANRREASAYLYPEGIRETLEGTCHEERTRLFCQMAAAGMRAEYGIMSAIVDKEYLRTIEHLFKGRFPRLLEETTKKADYDGHYWGTLDIRGKTIEEVFRIPNRQAINRIRNCNGGSDMVRWLQWSCRAGRKMPQETLEWLVKERINVTDLVFILDRMTPEQAMNYVRKQQAAGYKGKKANGILGQWGDYLSMCVRLGKDIGDEMVYRPRELLRRHGEAVEEIRKREMAEDMKRSKAEREAQARKMRERYPGAEEALKEVRPKYQYESGEYVIVVPSRLTDIIADSQALHHCAGATDRYFDRIMSRETYICFLRQKAEPGVPYYTVEVEPGGTIRQHRGYMDEEPDIDLIRPFLREWQQEVRKRLGRKDRELSAASKTKREQNIAELRRAGNTRVLNALMEDFMEA